MRIEWGKESKGEGSRGQHPEAEANIEDAKKLVERMHEKLPRGVDLKVCELYLMISYNPGIEVGSPKYAVPISFHQSRFDYSRQVEISLNGYIAHANAQLAKNPEQKVFPLLSGTENQSRKAC